ncbi:hypothetical protein AVEN_252297-1 [Araneus ventricosus]|uniref:Uncharacterized protein n=1 Tax=Araneus ventricosus TaxID=182803 RepID=A0A4Y2DQS8_ARAVE|nr:hypothetical protein AVEN_252297-1 [Araneus ventricosus]
MQHQYDKLVGGVGGLKDNSESHSIAGFEMTFSYGRGRCMETGFHTCSPKNFAINTWAYIVGSNFIKPCLIPPRLDSRKYSIFLQHGLPKNSKKNMFFDHCSAHCGFRMMGLSLITSVKSSNT